MQLTVPLSPIPAPRPRVTTQGWTYYPKRYKAWRERVGELLPGLLREAGLVAPLEGPLFVSCRFVVQRPKRTKLAHPRGDLDNYEKALWDQLTECGAWLDDNQVVHSQSRKEWSDPHTRGRIEVMLLPCH